MDRAFARGGQPDAELYLLRGLLAFAVDDFSLKTDDDFIAAAVMQPTNGYALLLQHVTAMLAGRPESSRLGAAQPADLAPGDGVTISASGMTLQFGRVGIPWWPGRLIGFFREEITSEQLLASAAGGLPEQAKLQQAEAAFYLSQASRIAGDAVAERTRLEQCVATPIDALAEYHLARERLRGLEAANTGSDR